MDLAKDLMFYAWEPFAFQSLLLLLSLFAQRK
jgi:hypothetical protein